MAAGHFLSGTKKTAVNSLLINNYKWKTEKYGHLILPISENDFPIFFFVKLKYVTVKRINNITNLLSHYKLTNRD